MGQHQDFRQLILWTDVQWKKISIITGVISYGVIRYLPTLMYVMCGLTGSTDIGPAAFYQTALTGTAYGEFFDDRLSASRYSCP